MPQIYLSLMAAPQLDLKEVISTFEPWCDGFHLDIMDNHLVPNLTFGSDMVNEIGAYTSKPLSIHLMITEPALFIPRLAVRRRDSIIVQYRSIQNPQALTQLIHKLPAQAGIALNPDIELKVIEEFDTLDYVFLMSVYAGFSGQDFLPESIQRAERLISYRHEHNGVFKIGMDGGIDATNIAQLSKIGVESFVIGSGVFDSENPLETLKHIKSLVDTSS